MTAVNYPAPDYLIREGDDLSVLPETYGDKLIVHLTLHPENSAYWTLADALLADIDGTDAKVEQEERMSYQTYKQANNQAYSQAYNQTYNQAYNQTYEENSLGRTGGHRGGYSLDRKDRSRQSDMYQTASPSYRQPIYSSTITISKCIKDGYDSEDSSPFLDHIFTDDSVKRSTYKSRSSDQLSEQARRQQSRSPLDRYPYSEADGSDVSRESTLSRAAQLLNKRTPSLSRAESTMSQLQPAGPPLLITVQQQEQTSYESAPHTNQSPAFVLGGPGGPGGEGSLSRGNARLASQDPNNTGRSTASRDLDDLMTSISEFDASVDPRSGAGQRNGSGGRGGGRGGDLDDIDSMPSLQLTSSTGAGNQGEGGMGANGAGGVNGGSHPVPQTQVFNASHVSHGVLRPGEGGGHAVHGKAGSEGMLIRLDGDSTDNGMLRIPKGDCAVCAKPVSGQVLLALNNVYHPEHFTCAHCRQQLGTNIFYEHSGQPFCEHDYQMLFSPKCAGCNGAILEKCISALNQSWHPEHFLCAACGKQFGDEGFHEKDGLAYCSDDYFAMFAPQCGGCQGAILDNYISALHKQWHPNCFVCQECGAPFESGSFYDHEGLPYCEEHFHSRRGSLCAACNKPISGRCVAAMYKKYHPEHFVCCFCLKPLNKGTFKENSEKPYCHMCFDKLFG